MNVKIVRGTTRGEHLCDKCEHIRTRTHEDGHVERQCSVSDEKSSWAYIRNSKVVECSIYREGGAVGLGAMYSTAWTWMKVNGQITFVDPNYMKARPEVEVRGPSFWKRLKDGLKYAVKG